MCHCLSVAESEVLVAIRGGADSVAGVGQFCEAGTACQSCHGPIRILLQAHARHELARSRAPKSLRQLSLFDSLVIVPAGSHKRPPS